MLPDASRCFQMLRDTSGCFSGTLPTWQWGRGGEGGGVNSTFADVRRMFDGRWIKMIDRRHRPPSSLLPPSSLPPPHLRGHCHPHPPPYLPLLPSATQSSFIRRPVSHPLHSPYVSIRVKTKLLGFLIEIQ